MDRAHKIAQERLPVNEADRSLEHQNQIKREIFCNGYYAAEKDLALNWEDIRTICLLTIGAEIVRDKPDLVDNVQEKLEQVFYEDVLRRFREMKDK